MRWCQLSEDAEIQEIMRKSVVMINEVLKEANMCKTKVAAME